MTPELIDDLKQFIQSAFLQYGGEISDRFDRLELRMGNMEDRMGGLELRMGGLELRMDSMEENIDLKLNVILDAVQERFENHEVRITKLETKTA